MFKVGGLISIVKIHRSVQSNDYINTCYFLIVMYSVVFFFKENMEGSENEMLA